MDHGRWTNARGSVNDRGPGTIHGRVGDYFEIWLRAIRFSLVPSAVLPSIGDRDPVIYFGNLV